MPLSTKTKPRRGSAKIAKINNSPPVARPGPPTIEQLEAARDAAISCAWELYAMYPLRLPLTSLPLSRQREFRERGGESEGELLRRAVAVYEAWEAAMLPSVLAHLNRIPLVAQEEIPVAEVTANTMHFAAGDWLGRCVRWFQERGQRVRLTPARILWPTTAEARIRREHAQAVALLDGRKAPAVGDEEWKPDDVGLSIMRLVNESSTRMTREALAATLAKDAKTIRERVISLIEYGWLRETEDSPVGLVPTADGRSRLPKLSA